MDVRYNLLELACLPGSTSNVTAVDCLTTRTMTTTTNGAMDHALSWHLYQTMRSIGLAPVPFVATIPNGVKPGEQFDAFLNGKNRVFVCPPGAGPGSKVQMMWNSKKPW